ncbi:hypothetical protein G6L37_05980 [Agrobacterium rubi]|nr:hypothetical protein [Agrobacterium rubi]NTF24909.1 hypothetical protein [Agrobacterium rubi]
MIRDDLPAHFHDDVTFAFGKEGGALWLAYYDLRERLTSYVDSGEHPELDGKAVGILHRVVKEFQIDDPMDFRMALQRITIDKDYYGAATIGMGDLLAVRAIESFLVTRVEYKIHQALQDRPLIQEIVGSVRNLGHSKGISQDIRLAEQAASACLSMVAAKASEHGLIASSDIATLASYNGVGI